MKKWFILFSFLLLTLSLSAQSWVQATSGTTAELQGIGWANSNVVWVSAADGSIIKSTDGGTTWVSAGNTGGGAGYYSIAALDANTAIAAFGPNSGNGKIFRTTDGGTTWTVAYTVAGAWFNFVDRIDGGNLWAQSDPVGGNFLIVRSTDGGANWFQISTNVPFTGAGCANSFYRLGNTFWFGTSNSNKVYRSDTGPEGPWVAYTSTANNVGTIAFNMPNGNGLAGFWSSSNVATSADGGKTWVSTTPAPTIGTPNGIDYVWGTSKAWAATSTGIWKTTDNGATWAQDQASTSALNYVKFFMDANKGLAVGVGGTIYKSTMTGIVPATVTHNTGTMQAGVFNNGYFGHDFTGGVGGGVIFSGAPDAMYTAGMMYGTSTTGVQGVVGSFTSSSVPVIADMSAQYGIYSFDSDPNFDQISYSGFGEATAPFPLGIFVDQKTYSKTGDNFVILVYDFHNESTNAITGFRVGQFADWDVGLANYAKNRGGVDAGNKLVYQYLNTAPINDPNYYGIVALNGLSGAKVVADFTWTATDLRSQLYGFISTVDAAPITADGDYRMFVGSGPYNIPPSGYLRVAFAIVAGTSLANLQANSIAAYNKGQLLVPVELTSFAATQVGNKVTLNWKTSTEVNNHGFEIERRIINNNQTTEWSVIGFRQGAGTTSEAREYSFSDDISALNATSVAYRLKQIDYDGTFEYSNEVMAESVLPTEFGLSQNYPNPFNPSTTIKYQLPVDKFVSLKVYNSLGEEVTTLVNGLVKAGKHQVDFSANNLASGVYFAVLRVGESEFVQTMKMMLMK